MHLQLEALQKLMRLLDPPLHAFFEERDCLNYFFCYRWLLLHFKRELAFEEVGFFLRPFVSVSMLFVAPCSGSGTWGLHVEESMRFYP